MTQATALIEQAADRSVADLSVNEEAFTWPQEAVEEGGRVASERTTVCLFSDDQLFRAGCEQLLASSTQLDLRLSTGAVSLDRALDFVGSVRPAVVIVGVPELDRETLEFVVEVHDAHPDSGWVLVFGTATPQAVSELRSVTARIRNGFACVSRDSIASAQHLHQMVEAVVDGRILLDQRVMDRLFDSSKEHNGVASRLSRREAEVLDLMSEGLTNPGIAGSLCLERKTVERHINSIYTKLANQAGEGHPRVNTILAYLRAAGRLDAA